MIEQPDSPRLDCTIFQALPYKRVISETEHGQEIFELYQLGVFNVDHPDSGGQPSEENIELVKLQAQSLYRPHFHKNSQAIIYIVLGMGKFMLGAETISYQPGQRIFIPAGVMHGFHTETATLFLSRQSPGIIDVKTGEIDIHYYTGETYANR